MHNGQGVAGLCARWIRLYIGAMARKVLHTPFVYDLKAFWAFLDGYATGQDVYPSDCGPPPLHRSPDVLWRDFTRVASDVNAAFYRNAKKPE
jgi:hypothetical protein